MLDLNKNVATIPDAPKENIIRTISKRKFKFTWQPVTDNQRSQKPFMPDEDKTSKQSLFLVPSTMLFNKLTGLGMI